MGIFIIVGVYLVYKIVDCIIVGCCQTGSTDIEREFRDLHSGQYDKKEVIRRSKYGYYARPVDKDNK